MSSAEPTSVRPFLHSPSPTLVPGNPLGLGPCTQGMTSPCLSVSCSEAPLRLAFASADIQQGLEIFWVVMEVVLVTSSR